MNRRVLAGLVVLILVAGFAPAPKPKPKEKPKNDLKALEGVWDITDRGGGAAGKGGRFIQNTQVKIDNEVWQFQMKQADGSIRLAAKYTIKLDVAKKPAWIDLTNDKALGGRTIQLLGIYEVNGDTLKVKYALNAMGAFGGKAPPMKRPEKFTDASGVSMTLKRVKK